MLYQNITAYSSAIKFTRLIPRNVCVQADGTMNSIKTLVLIQHLVERILYKKIKLSLKLPLLLGENYTEIKAWQLKFA